MNYTSLVGMRQAINCVAFFFLIGSANMNLFMAVLIGSKEEIVWDSAWKGPPQSVNLKLGASLQKLLLS